MKNITALLVAFLATTSAEAINLEAIQQIESGGNAKAYNDRSHAAGLYQITPICLEDYNRCTASNVRLADLFDPATNERIARWYFRQIDKYLDHYRIEKTDQNRIIAYNAGIGTLVKGAAIPQETLNYINKYNRITGV